MIKNKGGSVSTRYGFMKSVWTRLFLALLLATFLIVPNQPAFAAGGGITGVITGPDGPVSGLIVSAWRATGPGANSPPSAGDGTYTISGLAAGEYVVFIPDTGATGLARQYYLNATPLSRTPVVVADGQTTQNIHFSLIPGGSITGVVTRASDGQPVQGVSVSAFNANANGTTDWSYGSTTRADGSYSIPALPPGTYKVFASPPVSTGYALQYYPNADNFSFAQPLTVTGGETKTDIDLSLASGGKISGTVRSGATGNPLQGVVAAIRGTNFPPQANFGAVTAADGTYTISNLPAGNHRVLALVNSSNTGYIHTWYNNTSSLIASTPIAVAAGQTTTGIDIALAPGPGKITGRVVRKSDSQPLAGIRVRALSTGPVGNEVNSATTGWNGNYTLFGVPPGDYRIYADPPNEDYAGSYYNDAGTYNTATVVTATAGQTTPNINFSLNSGGCISGIVTGDDSAHTPIPGMVVRAYEDSVSGRSFGYYVSTQFDGSYTLTGLPAGTYKIRAYAFPMDAENDYVALYYNNVVQNIHFSDVSVTTGQTTPGIDFRMPVMGGNISGIVRGAANGQPIPALVMQAHNVDSGSLVAAVAITIRDGSYVLTGLPAGNYYVKAVATGTAFANGYYNVTRTVSTIGSASAVSVTVGQATPGIDFYLSDAGASISAAPTGGGVYGIGASVVLGGQVSSLEGDPLIYQWINGATTLFSGTIATIEGGTPVGLPTHTISNLPLGTHTITLQVSDGVNLPVSSDITVTIIDTTAPVVSPAPDKTILWPPNHKMAPLTIFANASDNSGLPVHLTASVASNEPESGLGDGDTPQDWTTPVIDNGIITLQLRAERAGKGNGRIYTVTIVATDAAGNASTAKVDILVPHDKEK